MKIMISIGRSKTFFRADGFTLIEVMVALTIMAIVTTVAFAGLSIGLDNWKRGSRRIDEMEHRARVERLVKNQLAMAYPMEFRVNTREKPMVLFRGKQDRVEFIADYSLVDGRTDFRKIGYLFTDGQFRFEERRLFGYVPSENEEVKGESIGIFSNMRFRFLTRDEGGHYAWVTEWSDDGPLPFAVEVTLGEDVIVVPLVNRR